MVDFTILRPSYPKMVTSTRLYGSNYHTMVSIIRVLVNTALVVVISTKSFHCVKNPVDV